MSELERLHEIWGHDFSEWYPHLSDGTMKCLCVCGVMKLLIPVGLKARKK